LIRRLILWVGVSGAAAFFLLLALAFFQPVTIEKWAHTAIAAEVQNRVSERLHTMESSRLVQSARGILTRNNAAIAEATASLESNLSIDDLTI
jgi:hypothetical protein